MLPLLLATGCATFSATDTQFFDYKRFTYDILRQADCREHDINEFCSRTFHFEYDEYAQMRQEYMRTEREKFLAEVSYQQLLRELHPEF